MPKRHRTMALTRALRSPHVKAAASQHSTDPNYPLESQHQGDNRHHLKNSFGFTADNETMDMDISSLTNMNDTDTSQLLINHQEKRSQETQSRNKNKNKDDHSSSDFFDQIDRAEWDETATVRRKQDLVDKDLTKYWFQRYRLFSRYDEGIRLDSQGWWSVTPELIAKQIAARCSCECIVDAFCGVGGNAIQFAEYCSKVIAIDISPLRLELARHNAEIYGVSDKITFVQADFVEWAKETSNTNHGIDVVFLSPPWGGIDYLDGEEQTEVEDADISKDQFLNQQYPLSKLQPIPGKDLYELSSTLTHNIAFFLPRNVNMEEIAQLSAPDLVELEEEWMGQKLKAITAYYGDLVSKVPV